MLMVNHLYWIRIIIIGIPHIRAISCIWSTNLTADCDQCACSKANFSVTANYFQINMDSVCFTLGFIFSLGNTMERALKGVHSLLWKPFLLVESFKWWKTLCPLEKHSICWSCALDHWTEWGKTVSMTFCLWIYFWSR